MAYVPKLGLEGLYSLTGPFENKLLPGVSYKCVAIRSFSDILSSGEEPFTVFYEPQGIEKADYEEHVIAGVVMVTLRSESDSVVYVPSEYISAHPELGGRLYTHLMVALDLGPLPDSLNLDSLLDELKSVAEARTGQEVTPYLTAVSAPVLVSEESHETQEAAREALRGSEGTLYARFLALQELYTALQTKYGNLEAAVIAQQS